MIRINIRSNNLIEVKSFVTKDDLEKYVRTDLTLLVGNDINSFLLQAEILTNDIWETNVGQSLKSDLGHVISVAGKSPFHNTEHGKQMYGS
tara:strand:- start:9 stop:281 length:273 start_codon:yes stop_codon:yes gene_type:complete